MREAPSLALITALQDAGAHVRAYDPEGMVHAKSILSGVDLAADPYACAEGAAALVVLTEWNQFRSLDFARLKQALARPLIVDLRNIYKPADMLAQGFTYVSIGRPAAGGVRAE